jgi:hypothetical protein
MRLVAYRLAFGRPASGEASMATWTSIATGTTCLVVTTVGLLLSLLVWRKKGPRSGLRGVAWSLLPIAMYLTNAVGLVGRIGSAIVVFATHFVFSPKAWLGVILAGLAILLFLITGGIPLLSGWRRHRQAEHLEPRASARDAGGHVTTTAAPSQRSSVPSADADFGDIEEILRRRGIRLGLSKCYIVDISESAGCSTPAVGRPREDLHTVTDTLQRVTRFGQAAGQLASCNKKHTDLIRIMCIGMHKAWACAGGPAAGR